MRALVVVLLTACGSPDRELHDLPPDHELHDLSSGDRYHYEGIAVDIANIPQIADAIGLPVSGTANIAIDITVPRKDLRKATGTIHILCTRCAIGNDKARLDTRSDFLGTIDFGHIAIDALAVEATIDHGKVTLDRFTLESGDATLAIDYEVRLAKSWDDSEVTGCIRYQVGDALAKRDPKTADVLRLTGAPLGEDGYFHIGLEGPAGHMRRLAKICR